MRRRNCRAHTTYRTESGRIVPGVTTVLGIINKPQLVKWANNLGLKGIDSAQYVSATARVGTLAHAMIQEHLGGTSVWERSEYAPGEIDLAENALLKFYEWEQQAGNVEAIMLETPLVSEIYSYGGTIDFYGVIGGKRWLIDFKTSDNIYVEHLLQCAAYWKLLCEQDLPVDGVRILRIGRDPVNGYEEKILCGQEVENYFHAFDLALQLHRALGILRGGV